jgi:arginyl-tRNA synthetase
MSEAVMNTLQECLVDALVKILASILDEKEDVIREYFEGRRLKISKTPDPKLGDYGVALHFIFHKYGIGRDEWSSFAEKIISELMASKYRVSCYIRDIKYVNGYLNFYIDYNSLFYNVIEDILYNKLFERLKSVGNKKRVIVEHTSANPIHPLHIGSGRNAVLGNTYARLLRYLGFNVRETFYVNDMGKQVAILVYGYKLLRDAGVKPRGDMKIDHWMGVVYALTNILIEKKKLSIEMNNLEQEIWRRIGLFRDKVNNLLSERILYPLISLKTMLDNLIVKQKLVHHTREIVHELIKTVDDAIKELKNRGYSRQAGILHEELVVFKEYERRLADLMNKFMEYSSSEDKLGSQYPEIYRVLASKITDPGLAENIIRDYMRRFEKGDQEIAKLFHEVSSLNLEGFKETLGRLGIFFDSFDWESNARIRELARMVVEGIEKTPYARIEEGALLVDLDKAASDHMFIRELFGRDQPGKFIIRRSDGTTLYTTRDVAYSIYKFRDLGADITYNVIATEQTREQRQVKAVLYLLGYRREAENLIHFVYEMVNLKGVRMSSRRGEYYTLDELVEDYKKVMAKNYVLNQIRKYNVLEPPETIDLVRLDDVFEKLAIASSRALLLSIDPLKVLSFDPRRLEEYSIGSWIMYTFVRLQGIIRKWLGIEPLDNLDKVIEESRKLLGEISGSQLILSPIEKDLLENIMSFEETIIKSYKELKPNKILEYTNNLSMNINKLYESLPVLGEKDPTKRRQRILLIITTLILMKDLLSIMGFPILKKI